MSRLLCLIIICILFCLPALFAYDAGSFNPSGPNREENAKTFETLKTDFVNVDCEKDKSQIEKIGIEILKENSLSVVEFFGGEVLARIYQPKFLVRLNNLCQFQYAITTLGEMKDVGRNAALIPLIDLMRFSTSSAWYSKSNSKEHLTELVAEVITALGKLKHPRSALPLLTYALSPDAKYDIDNREMALWTLMDIESPDLFFMSGKIKATGTDPYDKNNMVTHLDVWNTLLMVKGIEKGVEEDIDEGLEFISGRDGLYKRKILAILNAFLKSKAERKILAKIEKVLWSEWCEYYTVATKEIDDKYFEVALILSMKLGTARTITCPRYVIESNQNR